MDVLSGTVNTSIGLLFFQTLGPHGWTVSAHPIVTGDEAASLREKKLIYFHVRKWTQT
jgi:hypothetical protein